MAADINKAILCGRLTRDAELSYTSSGFAMTKFSIAVNRTKKEGDQWVDKGNFFDIIIWGKRGEALNMYLVKGQQVVIEGELQQETWEKDGQKRSKVSIDCKNLQLVGAKKEPKSQSESKPSQESYGSGNGAGGNLEDDIPF